LAELEAVIAVLKHNQETASSSQPPHEMITPAESHLAPQSESEIAVLKIKITEMVEIFISIDF
jgi:hypothetical protein